MNFFYGIGIFMVFLQVDSVFGSIKILDGNDPGSCDSSNHGEEMLVKDRENNEKLLICSENDGVFLWTTTDGSSSPGELFDPGQDCSDILDRNVEAKDGFYWVLLGDSDPKKVWCDMTTDGGGFMLIGRKNNSVTWSVPSGDDTVEPFGFPHWSSALGNTPILDFRVQIATRENFNATKAHWFFRLKSKRQLKHLMILGQGGCDTTSPGIGDIAYVKDLQTEEIVTTTFQCSRFGGYYHPTTKLGWAMMNSCLQKPCVNGFAFHHKYPIQVDYSGAFSYSTTGNVSGILHDSTSFVGCDKGHCCACYGPIGGKLNYCQKECKTINGGTITTNVFTWFWVRSSNPKRIWHKCMEYKSTKANGDIVWYKLMANNVVPSEGRCAKNEALLNDGIVVVRDAQAAKNVPPVPGLLAYRKDNKELYVRANESWNIVAQNKKVISQTLGAVKPRLRDFENKLKNQDAVQQETLKAVNLLQKKFDDLNRTLNSHVSYYLSHRNSKIYYDASGWVLVARFSNRDPKNWMNRSGYWWYDRVSSYGNIMDPSNNNDMISEAFWGIPGREIKITRSDDSTHTALLQTTSNCLQGNTFRYFITKYGNFRKGAIWSNNKCLGNCQVSYGGQYKSTAGFEKYNCSGNIQRGNYIGFWCDWSGGDGAVMMIGGGGGWQCDRADHGIGVTEENEAKFGGNLPHNDFGFNEYNHPSSYSLNLWVR